MDPEQQRVNSQEPETTEARSEGLRLENRKRLKRRVATIGVVLAVAAGVQWYRSIGVWVLGHWYAAKAGGRALDVRAAEEMISNQNVLVIDVRTPEEFAVSHLAHARSLPWRRLKKEGWPAGWPTDRPVITYCTIGYRSGLAAKYLDHVGIRSWNLRGGILALAQARMSLVDETGPTSQVHTWSRWLAWMLPKAYQAIASDDPTPAGTPSR